jgi:hypothetical protein
MCHKQQCAASFDDLVGAGAISAVWSSQAMPFPIPRLLDIDFDPDVVLIWLRRIVRRSLARIVGCASAFAPDADADARELSEIGHLQKPAVADPASGKVSLGLACRDGVAAQLM